MALIDDIQSMPATGLSGSAGTIVASRNQYGPYFRARTSPTGVPTLRQALARQALADSAALWQTVTHAQRLAWEAYAIALRRTQPRSTLYPLNGRHQFMRTNCIRFRLPYATEPWSVKDAPLPTVQPILHHSRVESFTSTAKIRVFFDTADPWVSQDGSALLLYASPALTDTIHFHLAPMRLAIPLWGSSGSPPSSPQDMAWPYSATSGSKPVNVVLRLTLADGRLSRRYRDRAEVPS